MPNKARPRKLRKPLQQNPPPLLQCRPVQLRTKTSLCARQKFDRHQLRAPLLKKAKRRRVRANPLAPISRHSVQLRALSCPRALSTVALPGVRSAPTLHNKMLRSACQAHPLKKTVRPLLVHVTQRGLETLQFQGQETPVCLLVEMPLKTADLTDLVGLPSNLVSKMIVIALHNRSVPQDKCETSVSNRNRLQ